MCDFCENIPKTDEELGKMIMNGAENIIFHDKERGFCLYGDTGDSGCPYCLDNIKFCPYCGKIVAGKIPNGYKVNEEPLPFSSDEYEEEIKVELPTMPIDVASMLINATIEYPTISLLKAFGAGETSVADKYSKSDLREIAEHLLVYCNNSDEDDTQS